MDIDLTYLFKSLMRKRSGVMRLFSNNEAILQGKDQAICFQGFKILID